jgi:hypothetical protein
MNRSDVRRSLLSALLLAGAVAGRAEVNDCTPITSVPTTIGSAGVYCLTGNLVLASTGVAIHILGAKDVVLDFNGHSLTGPANGTALLVEDASRVTVRNGSIVNFRRGAYVLPNAFNATLEDLHVSVTGELPAIESRAWGDVIQRNWIERGSPAILTYGTASRISDNDLPNPTSGIDAGGANVSIEGNRVYRNGSATGTFGIRTASGRAILSDNDVSGFSICFDMGSNTRYRDNTTNACTNTYTGGTSASGNN